MRSGRRSIARHLKLAAALAVGAFAAILAAAQPATAQGLFDFLFGRSEQRSAPTPPSNANSYADPYGTPAPERPRYGGGGSAGGIGARSVAYCVRLCDGQHFPIQHFANATPVEICKAMCPASKTKIYFGSTIDHSVASDGTSYASLDNAYSYRDKLVPDCTCNGKNAFGLAPIDVNKDPTLRPGDMVSTGNGLLAYSGQRNRQTAEFTPVDSSVPLAELAHKSTKVRMSRRGASESSAQRERSDPPEQFDQRSRGPDLDLRGQVAR